MESVYLKTFLEAINTGSFSKTADSLCVTQSAVSRRVKHLEDHFGCTLLDRSGGMIRPTAEGQLLIDKARLIIAAEEEFRRELDALHRRRDAVTFCCTPDFGISYLPAVMKKFMMLHPDMSALQFMFEQPARIVAGLRENRFDLAVIEHCLSLDLRDFETIELPDDEVVFISSPKADIRSPHPEIEDLLPFPLYSRKEGCCSQIFLNENLAGIGRSGREFQNVIVCDDLHLIIEAIISGGGIGFISRSAVGRQLDEGTLLEHRISGFQHRRKRTLAFNRPMREDTITRRFLHCVLDSFELAHPPASVP